MRKTTIVVGAMTLFLFGCATQVPPNPPVAVQKFDLHDNDGDGVINARDFCAKTPNLAVINNDGCPIEVNQDKDNSINVLFANDQSVIPDSFDAEIKQMSDFLMQFPTAHIELQGYASPVGNSEHNWQLSESRALAVRQALMNDGVSVDRILINPHGDSDPVKALTSEDTNTLSRRVTAKVVGSQGGVVKQWTIYTVRSN